MKTYNVDLLNTGLIIISLIFAYWLPFELFIFVYAVLGPLHYFTEINWIRDKEYFVENNKIWISLTIIFCVLLSIPLLLRLPVFEAFKDATITKQIAYYVPKYLNSCSFLIIAFAIAFVGFKKKIHQYIVIILGVILAVLLHFYELYQVIFGILVPTVIHVYLFTLLFMWYGNLKSKSRIGYFNVLLLFAVPFIIAFVDFSLYNFSIGETTVGIYNQNKFHMLNMTISKFFGFSNGTTFSLTNLIDVKIQIFIAFAYTYHYLNWFSKTTVIGWHKKLTQKRSLLILTLWIVSVGLYFYDYKIGLTLLFFLSLLHVFMEFPLNVISIKSIGASIFNPKKT
ncbi:hypothetical protein [uncultured Kordia sp.]|uniref:hypothetical protein n=1 Tax=uncultured Kordia sp. TaxID=507699 RepID=UPI002621B1FC|nr:hypothetical protein [uncultured Kordia sp.]